MAKLYFDRRNVGEPQDFIDAKYVNEFVIRNCRNKADAEPADYFDARILVFEGTGGFVDEAKIKDDLGIDTPAITGVMTYITVQHSLTPEHIESAYGYLVIDEDANTDERIRRVRKMIEPAQSSRFRSEEIRFLPLKDPNWRERIRRLELQETPALTGKHSYIVIVTPNYSKVKDVLERVIAEAQDYANKNTVNIEAGKYVEFDERWMELRTKKAEGTLTDRERQELLGF